jgi:CHAD domain-containing protein
VKARSVRGLDPAGPLRPNAARIVAVRLAELHDLAEPALAPEASEAQHDLRIAAKRLRYLLEIFAPCLGGEADAARRTAKELQSVLGDLHDCDLMLPRVAQISAATAALRERRERLHREFVQLWRSAARRGAWAALESTLRLSATR